MRYNRPYTNIQQSKEIHHNAAQSFNQPLVLKFDSKLSIWINSNERKPLLKEWQIAGIADKFRDYPSIITPQTNAILESPNVNIKEEKVRIIDITGIRNLS